VGLRGDIDPLVWLHGQCPCSLCLVVFSILPHFVGDSKEWRSGCWGRLVVCVIGIPAPSSPALLPKGRREKSPSPLGRRGAKEQWGYPIWPDPALAVTFSHKPSNLTHRFYLLV
jgi:hypothetical protein